MTDQPTDQLPNQPKNQPSVSSWVKKKVFRKNVKRMKIASEICDKLLCSELVIYDKFVKLQN